MSDTELQHEIEELASAIMEERPDLSTAAAVRLAAASIGTLTRYSQDWDRASALDRALEAAPKPMQARSA